MEHSLSGLLAERRRTRPVSLLALNASVVSSSSRWFEMDDGLLLQKLHDRMKANEEKEQEEMANAQAIGPNGAPNGAAFLSSGAASPAGLRGKKKDAAQWLTQADIDHYSDDERRLHQLTGELQRVAASIARIATHQREMGVHLGLPDPATTKFEAGEKIELQVGEGAQQGRWIKASIIGPGDRPNTWNVHVPSAKKGSKDMPNVPAMALRKDDDEGAVFQPTEAQYEVGEQAQVQIAVGPLSGQWVKCSIKSKADLPDTYNIYVPSAPVSHRDIPSVPARVLRKAEAKGLFNQYDTDGDGLLSTDEFKVALREKATTFYEENVKKDQLYQDGEEAQVFSMDGMATIGQWINCTVMEIGDLANSWNIFIPSGKPGFQYVRNIPTERLRKVGENKTATDATGKPIMLIPEEAQHEILLNSGKFKGRWVPCEVRFKSETSDSHTVFIPWGAPDGRSIMPNVAGEKLRKRVTCGEGYEAIFDGDSPGYDHYERPYNRKETAEDCAVDCSKRFSCKSYEWSPSVKECYLNKVSDPSLPANGDYLFCRRAVVPQSKAAFWEGPFIGQELEYQVTMGDFNGTWHPCHLAGYGEKPDTYDILASVDFFGGPLKIANVSGVPMATLRYAEGKPLPILLESWEPPQGDDAIYRPPPEPVASATKSAGGAARPAEDAAAAPANATELAQPVNATELAAANATSSANATALAASASSEPASVGDGESASSELVSVEENESAAEAPEEASAATNMAETTPAAKEEEEDEKEQEEGKEEEKEDETEEKKEAEEEKQEKEGEEEVKEETEETEEKQEKEGEEEVKEETKKEEETEEKEEEEEEEEKEEAESEAKAPAEAAAEVQADAGANVTAAAAEAALEQQPEAAAETKAEEAAPAEEEEKTEDLSALGDLGEDLADGVFRVDQAAEVKQAGSWVRCRVLGEGGLPDTYNLRFLTEPEGSKEILRNIPALAMRRVVPRVSKKEKKAAPLDVDGIDGEIGESVELKVNHGPHAGEWVPAIIKGHGTLPDSYDVEVPGINGTNKQVKDVRGVALRKTDKKVVLVEEEPDYPVYQEGEGAEVLMPVGPNSNISYSCVVKAKGAVKNTYDLEVPSFGSYPAAHARLLRKVSAEAAKANAKEADRLAVSLGSAMKLLQGIKPDALPVFERLMDERRELRLWIRRTEDWEVGCDHIDRQNMVAKLEELSALSPDAVAAAVPEECNIHRWSGHGFAWDQVAACFQNSMNTSKGCAACPTKFLMSVADKCVPRCAPALSQCADEAGQAVSKCQQLAGRCLDCIQGPLETFMDCAEVSERTSILEGVGQMIKNSKGSSGLQVESVLRDSMAVTMFLQMDKLARQALRALLFSWSTFMSKREL